MHPPQRDGSPLPVVAIARPPDRPLHITQPSNRHRIRSLVIPGAASRPHIVEQGDWVIVTAPTFPTLRFRFRPAHRSLWGVRSNHGARTAPSQDSLRYAVPPPAVGLPRVHAITPLFVSGALAPESAALLRSLSFQVVRHRIAHFGHSSRHCCQFSV